MSKRTSTPDGYRMPYMQPQEQSEARASNDETARRVEKNVPVRLWRTYRRWINTQPVLTKSITAAVLHFLADITAQRVNKQAHFEWARSARFGLWGLVFVGPGIHRWHSFLDNSFRRQKIRGYYAVVGKLVIDQLLFAPFCLLLFFFFMNVLEKFPTNATRSYYLYAACKEQMSRELVPALKMNWKVWPLAQFVNFAFVKGDYRVLFVRACDCGLRVD